MRPHKLHNRTANIIPERSSWTAAPFDVAKRVYAKMIEKALVMSIFELCRSRDVWSRELSQAVMSLLTSPRYLACFYTLWVIQVVIFYVRIEPPDCLLQCLATDSCAEQRYKAKVFWKSALRFSIALGGCDCTYRDKVYHFKEH